MDSKAVNVRVHFYSGEPEESSQYVGLKMEAYCAHGGEQASNNVYAGNMLLDTFLRYENRPACKSCLNLSASDKSINECVGDQERRTICTSVNMQTPTLEGMVQIHQNMKFSDSPSNVSSTTNFNSNAVKTLKNEEELLIIAKKILGILEVNDDSNITSSDFVKGINSHLIQEAELKKILDCKIQNFKNVTLTLEDCLSDISNSLKYISDMQEWFSLNSNIKNVCCSSSKITTIAEKSPSNAVEIMNKEIQEMDRFLKLKTKLCSICKIEQDVPQERPSATEKNDTSIMYSGKVLRHQDAKCQWKTIGDALGFVVNDNSHVESDKGNECPRWTGKDRSIYTDKRFGYIPRNENYVVTSTGSFDDSKMVMYPTECDSDDDTETMPQNECGTALEGPLNLNVIVPPARLISSEESLAPKDRCAGHHSLEKPLLKNVEENFSYKTNVFNEKKAPRSDSIERCFQEEERTPIQTDQHTRLKQRLQIIGKEFTNLQETSALLHDQVDSLQYKLVESQQQVYFRDGQITLLKNQLQKLESDYSTNITLSNQLKLKLSLNEFELEQLRNDCVKYKQSLLERDSMADNLSTYMQMLQDEAVKWKQQFDEAQARMLSMEKETEQLRISLQIDSNSTLSTIQSNYPIEDSTNPSNEVSQSISYSTLEDQSFLVCAPPEPSNTKKNNEPVKLPATENKDDILWTDQYEAPEMSMEETTEYSDESDEDEESGLTEEAESVITKKVHLFLKEGHSLRNLDDLKNELLNAKDEASKTKDELRLKIKDLEKDIWKHKDLNIFGICSTHSSVKASNSCPNMDVTKKNPVLDLSCTIKIKSNELTAVTQVGTDINERIKYLEKLVEQFKEKQSELALHISSVNLLSAEVDEIRKLGFPKEPSNIVHLKRELSNERRVSEDRLRIISAQTSEVDGCHRELSQLRNHLSKLTNDFMKLSKWVNVSDPNQIEQKIKYLQHDLEQKTAQLKYKDDELLNLLKSIEVLKKQQCDVCNEFQNEQERVQRMEIDLKALNNQKMKEIERLKEEKQILFNNCQQLKQEVEKSNLKVVELQSDREKQQDELNNLKMQLTNTSSELNIVVNKMKICDDELVASQQIIEELLSEKLMLDAKITELTNNLQIVNNKLKLKENETTALSSEKKKFIFLNKEQEILINELKTNLSKISSEKIELENNFKNSIKECSDLKQKLSTEMENKKKLSSKSFKDMKTKEMSALMDKLFKENNELRKMLDYLGTNMMESIMPRLCTISGDFMAQSMMVPIKCFKMNKHMRCNNVQCISSGKCLCKFVTFNNEINSGDKSKAKTDEDKAMLEKLEHMKSKLDSTVEEQQYHMKHSWDGIISKSCRSGKHCNIDGPFDSIPNQCEGEGVETKKLLDSNEYQESIDPSTNELSPITNKLLIADSDRNWLPLQITRKPEITNKIVCWKSALCNDNQTLPFADESQAHFEVTNNSSCVMIPPSFSNEKNSKSAPCTFPTFSLFASQLNQLRGPIFHPYFKEIAVTHSTSLTETRIEKTISENIFKCPIFELNPLKDSYNQQDSACSLRDDNIHEVLSREFYIKPSFYYPREVLEECDNSKTSITASSATIKVSQSDKAVISPVPSNEDFRTTSDTQQTIVTSDTDFKSCAVDSEKYEEDCATSHDMEEISEEMTCELEEYLSIDSTKSSGSHYSNPNKNMSAEHLKEIRSIVELQNEIGSLLNEMKSTKNKVQHFLNASKHVQNIRVKEKDEEEPLMDWQPVKLTSNNKPMIAIEDNLESDSHRTLFSPDSYSSMNEDGEGLRYIHPNLQLSSEIFPYNVQTKICRRLPGKDINVEGNILLHNIQEMPFRDLDEEDDDDEDDDTSVITVIDVRRDHEMYDIEPGNLLRALPSKKRLPSVVPCLSSVLETDEILSCTTLYRGKYCVSDSSTSEICMESQEGSFPDTTTAITIMSMFTSLMVKKRNHLPQVVDKVCKIDEEKT